MMCSEPIRERAAARVILLDEQDRVLLFEYDDPNYINPLMPDSSRFWCTPGGGINPGETIEDAARRELWEEIGLTDVFLGPMIATLRGDLLVQGELVRHVNHILVARVIAPQL
jgi:8-oxo-dGTP pyrophosphatase MutT (NUDIX family)